MSYFIAEMPPVNRRYIDEKKQRVLRARNSKKRLRATPALVAELLDILYTARAVDGE